jgi:PAS domain S-box-containing protein
VLTLVDLLERDDIPDDVRAFLTSELGGQGRRNESAAPRDGSEQRRPSTALPEPDRKLQKIFDSLPIGMHRYRLQRDGRLVFEGANPAADMILGVANSQFVGKTIEEAFPPLAATEVPERYRHVAITGQPWRTEQIDYRDDQIRGAYEVHAFQIEPARMAAVFSDITERKRAEEALRRAHEGLEQRVAERTEELRALNRELEAFAYSVSHDLRTPLRAIDGFARMLEEDFAERLGPEGARRLSVIRSSAQEMGRLIDDLLALSRLGRRTLEKHPLPLRPLVEEVFRQLRAEVGGRSLELKVDSLPEIHADPGLIRQVVANLLSNAIKYTSPRPEALIEVGARTEEHEHVITVADNGVGFDPGHADRLFRVFSRLHPAAEFEGTGIGLALVQRIVARHGGRVWAEGQVDRGARFFFTLPRSIDGPRRSG